MMMGSREKVEKQTRIMRNMDAYQEVRSTLMMASRRERQMAERGER